MPRNDEVLTVGIDVDIASAVKAMNRFEKDMKKRMTAVTNITKNLNKTNIEGIREVTDNLDDWLDDLDDLALAHDKQNKKLQDQIDLIEKLRKKEANAADDQKGAIRANIKALEQQAKQTGKVLATKLLGKAHFNESLKDFDKFFNKVTDTGGAVFSSFFSKDLKGLIENSGKASGKLFGWALKKGASGAMKGGKALSERGEAMGGGGGAAMKMMGGVMSKMGGAFSTLAKLGPILASMSTVLLAVVKIMIDAEAQAKQFNKDLLQGASTTEFLARNAGDADAAYQDLRGTLGQIRDAAFDAKQNLAWGINADDHKAIYETLRSEGVSLASVAAQAKVAGQSVKDFSSELVHTNVAFSRGIGVPLQEISSFQAEMMTSLGMSLDTTKLAFSQMTRSASESGIAANKFFQIIRSVSTDLSLYNTRMEQAVKTLKLLGKVMDPKNAQKFMQSITQAFKTMGQDDRLKVALLAGGKGAQIVQKDIKNKEKNLNKDIADALGQKGDEAEAAIAKRLADPKLAKGLWKEVEEKAKDKLGTLRESSLELGIDKRASKNGVYGQAFAMENLGVGASLDMMKAAIAPWGGGDLRHGAGSLDMTKMAENMGIGTTELRGMMKVEQAVEDQKNALLDRAQTDEEKAKINAMSTQDIIDSMSEEEQKILEDSSKTEIDFAKKQGDLTQSLLDKLGVLVDFVMNEIYNVMQGIFDAVCSIPGVSIGKGMKDARATNNKELIKAFGTEDTNKALADSALVKSMNKAFDDLRTAGERYTSAQNEKMILQNKGPLSAEEEKRMADLDKEMETIRSQTQTARNVRDSMLSAMPKSAFGNGAESAFADAGLTEEQRIQAYNSMMGGSTAKMALTDAGASGDQINDLLRKLPIWTNNVDSAGGSRAKMLGDAGKLLEEGGYYTTEQKRIDEKQAASAEDTAKATSDLHKDATNDGTRFSSNFLNNAYADTIEKSTLAAMRQALFEYYMYSEIEDRQQVVDYMSTNGMDPQGFAKYISDSAQGLNNKPAMTAMDAIGGTDTIAGGEAPQKKLKANASGGLVTNTSSGLAEVRAAGGEGLASVGVGERIIPAGGKSGTGDINIQVNGVGGNDLARMVRATVIDTVAEYKRRERFTP